MVRQGTIDNPPKPPVVPGFECSGIVEAVGENAEGFEVDGIRHTSNPLWSLSQHWVTQTIFSQIGDRVMAFVNCNAWAEVVCTPAEFVYKMPDEMTFAEAAAFTVNFVAAYMMLFEVANLREGMSVLVHSAGGGVVSTSLSASLIHRFSKIKPFKDTDWKESAASKDRFYHRPVSMIVFSFTGKLLHSVGGFRVRRWLSCAPRCLTSQCLGSPPVSSTPPSGTLWLTSSTEMSITCKKSKSKSRFSGDLFVCPAVRPVP